MRVQTGTVFTADGIRWRVTGPDETRPGWWFLSRLDGGLGRLSPVRTDFHPPEGHMTERESPLPMWETNGSRNKAEGIRNEVAA